MPHRNLDKITQVFHHQQRRQYLVQYRWCICDRSPTLRRKGNILQKIACFQLYFTGSCSPDVTKGKCRNEFDIINLSFDVNVKMSQVVWTCLPVKYKLHPCCSLTALNALHISGDLRFDPQTRQRSWVLFFTTVFSLCCTCILYEFASAVWMVSSSLSNFSIYGLLF